MAQQQAQNIHVMESPKSLVAFRRPTKYAGKHGVRAALVDLTLQSATVSAAWISGDPKLKAEEIYGMYEAKLNSYDGKLGMFLWTTVPYLALSLPISVLWRTLRLINRHQRD